MKSKISDNKCHNIDMNNQSDKIPESAPSELRYTTINKNNHKNISKNEIDEKINNENINNSMANNINSQSGSHSKQKISVIRTRETVSIVMRGTATVTTMTIAVAKKIR